MNRTTPIKKYEGHGVRAEQRGLSAKLQELAQHVARMLYGINQRFVGQDAEITALKEQVEACVHLISKEDVEAYVKNARTERARLAAEQEKAALESNIKDGFVIPAEMVGEKSVVVGRYLLKDGVVQEPGRSQLAMPGIAPQFRDKLIGQKVGFVLDIGGDNKFELTEVYNVDEEKARAVMLERQKAALEAATKAAAEASGDDEGAEQAGQPADEPAAEEAE